MKLVNTPTLLVQQRDTALAAHSISISDINSRLQVRFARNARPSLISAPLRPGNKTLVDDAKFKQSHQQQPKPMDLSDQQQLAPK
ncbi:hypothetical protein J1614_008218 [Plenodomus biglobosus]|nr:hypothetical protein J1614_008218 [Plenodomus biglobosus]